MADQKEIRQISMDQLRIKSVQRRKKDYEGQFYFLSNTTTAQISLLFLYSHADRQVRIEETVRVLQTISGARASEILRLTNKNIISDDTLVIRGAKGSRDREIRIPEFSEYFILVRRSPLFKLFPISYSRYYRYLKQRGYFVKNGSGRNDTVSHLSRYAKIISINDAFGADTAQDIIGHRSPRSTEHYLRKKGE